jgi:DNA-binding CsgD family transcriptional regulator
MVVFPFDISKIYRFFDFSQLLKKHFNLKFEENEDIINLAFRQTKSVELTDTEKNVFCIMTSYPELSDANIGRELGISRHTVSRIRREFENKNFIRRINLPDLKKFGFEILVFYHIRFDPRNPPNIENDEAAMLMSDSSIFFACRQFEAVMISVYSDYDDYKSDSINVTQLLKQNGWIAQDPKILSYSMSNMIFIKDFKFAPITQKIVGCDSWIKKLLNM